VERQTLNNLVNEHSGVSPEMAIRLSKAFGSTPEMWLGLQMQYDLAQAKRNAAGIKIEKLIVSGIGRTGRSGGKLHQKKLETNLP
jgi:plasmid maintenance system antidote protein VapI